MPGVNAVGNAGLENVSALGGGGSDAAIEGKQIDDLQLVMREIRAMEWEAPIVFENMR